MTLPARFWDKVVEADNGCWLWTGALTSGGYGSYGVDGKSVSVHVLTYREFIGEIPPGLTLDHLCHDPRVCPGGRCYHRRCCNPYTVEPVPQVVNTRRGMTGLRAERTTHCPKGHPYDLLNPYVNPRGERQCRECVNSYKREKRKAARLARLETAA